MNYEVVEPGKRGGEHGFAVGYDILEKGLCSDEMPFTLVLRQRTVDRVEMRANLVRIVLVREGVDRP